MKRTHMLIMALACMAGTFRASAQQTDPALVAAVTGNIAMINQYHDERSDLQKKIIESQALVTASIDKVHDVENKMLGYLSNVSGAMQNLYQIKRAGELVVKEIPGNIKLLTKSIPDNIMGTAITAVVSSKVDDVKDQMMSLYPFLEQLVTSGTYNVSDGKGGNKKHKVNLLNSAERYYIANEVLFRLERINTDIWLLAWQVKYMNLTDLWFHLDPKGWATYMNTEHLAKTIIADWKKL